MALTNGAEPAIATISLPTYFEPGCSGGTNKHTRDTEFGLTLTAYGCGRTACTFSQSMKSTDIEPSLEVNGDVSRLAVDAEVPVKTTPMLTIPFEALVRVTGLPLVVASTSRATIARAWLARRTGTIANMAPVIAAARIFMDVLSRTILERGRQLKLIFPGHY
jgi:hypothetical protein